MQIGGSNAPFVFASPLRERLDASDLAQKQFHRRRHIGKGLDGAPGIELGELPSGVVAGGDGEASGTTGSCAANVLWGITDDDDFGRGIGRARGRLHALGGDGAELVAVMVITAETTIEEAVKNAVMAELDGGTTANIAGEQAEMRVFLLTQAIEEVHHAGKHETAEVRCL